MNTALSFFQTREIQVSCNECGCLTNLDYFDDHDGLCPQCWDQRHFCAGCGREFDEELPESNDKSDYRYCDSCYRENSEAITSYVAREIRKLAEQAREALSEVKKKFIDCDKPDFLEYGANVAGYLTFLADRLSRLATDLEEI